MAKVKMAIIGCGGMAGQHAKRLLGNDDVEIVALCDVKEEIVEGFIKQHLAEAGVKPQIFTDVDKLYADSGADGVVVVSPHTLHFDHGMKALDAGFHVLMEKPMVTNAGRARELAAVGELYRETRLLTLTGPGGCGKSRLSLRLAQEVRLEHVDGVWLLELSERVRCWRHRAARPDPCPSGTP